MSLRRLTAALLLAGALSLAACASQDEDVWEFVEPSAGYPLTTCPISDNTLDENRVAIRYQGEEVHLHCESDLHAFLAHPEEGLAKVRAARGR